MNLHCSYCETEINPDERPPAGYCSTPCKDQHLREYRERRARRRKAAARGDRQ